MVHAIVVPAGAIVDGDQRFHFVEVAHSEMRGPLAYAD